MAARLDREHVLVGEFGTGPVVAGGVGREGGVHVEFGQRLADPLTQRRGGGHLLAKLPEQFVLQFAPLFFQLHYVAFSLAELRRGEPL